MDGQKMQAIYNDVDTDNNGYITRDELQAYKEKNGLNDLNVDVSQDVGLLRTDTSYFLLTEIGKKIETKILWLCIR